MSMEDISSSDPTTGNVVAPTPATKKKIMDALAKDIRSVFKDISSSDPSPRNVAALTRAWREGKDVVPSIKRQFGYVMSSKSYAQDLQKEARNLEKEAKRIHNVAEGARNNLCNFYSEFTEWQQSADKALEEARDLLDNFENATKTCCHGTLPDPKCRYQFSRKAEGRIKVIKQLAQKCSGFKELNDISCIAPPPGNVTAPTPARREGKDVVPSTTATGTFESRALIEVKSCDKMEVLTPFSLVRELPQLREIRVVNCKLMREIIEADNCGKIELRNLQVLELRDLPNIRNFLPAGMDPSSSTSDRQVSTQVAFFSGQQVVFPNLETLNITGMHNIEMIWDNQVYFQHLKTLDVSHCHLLSNIFTPTIAGNLVELTKLRISNCKMLTEVINDEGGKEGHAVAFNQLKSMELNGLTGLRCFSSSGYTLMFPLLEDVIVTRCLNMKFFSKGPIEAPKLEKVHVSIATWFWKENLNITIHKMWEEMATVAGAEFMRLSEFPEPIENCHGKLIPIEPFSKLETLVVDKCPFINAVPSILMLALHNLRNLQVRDCESLEEIFDLEGLEGAESTQVLPQLCYLGLVNLPKLRRLWNKNLQGRLRFISLSQLTLYNCNNLRHAFAPSMIQCLATLEYIEIKKCGQMEGVIAKEEGHGSAMEKITFPNLWWMELEYLPNLTSFLSRKNHTLECPDLKWLTIAHCPKMRSFTRESLMEIDHSTPSLFTPQDAFPSLETLRITGMDNIQMIWDNQVYFQHLKTLDVSHCNQLSYMFTPTIAENLVELAKLRISNCERLTEVVRDEEGEEGCVVASNQLKNTKFDWLRCLKEGQGRAMETIKFPSLCRVELESLPKLINFLSRNNHMPEWPKLKELTIVDCPKMTRIGTLFPRPLSFISGLCMDIQNILPLPTTTR